MTWLYYIIGIVDEGSINSKQGTIVYAPDRLEAINTVNKYWKEKNCNFEYISIEEIAGENDCGVLGTRRLWN